MGQDYGFTIVETMIFLAVSSVLFISTVAIFTSQQRSSEFRHAVQDVETKLQDIINDTSTGYFDALKGYTCRGGSGTPPTFTSPVEAGQGKNLECIFIGKTILLRPNGRLDTIEISPVVGNRLVGTAPNQRDVQTFAEAQPTTVYPSPDLTASYSLKNSVRVKSTNHNLIGIYGSLAQYSPSGQPVSSAQRAVMVKHTPAGTTKALVKTCVQQRASDACYVKPTDSSFADPWTICLHDEIDTSKTALITIDSNTLNNRLEIIAC